MFTSTGKRVPLRKTPAGTSMIRRVLVSDSDPVDAAQLIAHLATQPFDVEWETRGRIALERCQTDQFDLLIVSETLHDMTGLSFCHQVRLSNPLVPLIFLCSGDSHQDRVAALTAGADDSLARPFDLHELSARALALLRRSMAHDGTGGRNVGSMHLDHATRKVSCCDHTIDLSMREFDLLLYLASRPQHVITRDEILFDVWGADFDGNTNIVDVYVGYLRRKLSGGRCAHRIETVRGTGYRYVVENRDAPPPSRAALTCPGTAPA